MTVFLNCEAINLFTFQALKQTNKLVESEHRFNLMTTLGLQSFSDTHINFLDFYFSIWQSHEFLLNLPSTLNFEEIEKLNFELLTNKCDH